MAYTGSFPFLAIAKKHGVDYGDVVRFAEEIDTGRASDSTGYVFDHVVCDIILACRREQERRAANCPESTP